MDKEKNKCPENCPILKYYEQLPESQKTFYRMQQILTFCDHCNEENKPVPPDLETLDHQF